MWTTENRPRYDRDKLRYPSDLTDAEWAQIEPAVANASRSALTNATASTTGRPVRAPPSCISEASQGQLLQGSLVQRRLAETALTAVVQEAYVHGITTRSFDDVLQTMGCSGVSKNQVSRLSANVDERGIPASADRR
jgi:Transposase, Mutator family